MRALEQDKVIRIEKSTKSHSALRSVQTGFASPATHYAEPRIDLNEVLIENANATFYVRVDDDSFKRFGIAEDDVLIIDKSMEPVNNSLALVTEGADFKIHRFSYKKSETPLQIWGVITYIIKSVKA